MFSSYGTCSFPPFLEFLLFSICHSLNIRISSGCILKFLSFSSNEVFRIPESCTDDTDYNNFNNPWLEITNQELRE